MQTPEGLLKFYKEDMAAADISAHLEILKSYSAQCNLVTEFGFREGASFSALVAGNPKKATTYDIRIQPQHIDRFKNIETKTEIVFKQENTTQCLIEDTDFLFIDTLHTFQQLKTELWIHGLKARQFLGFHDIQSFGDRGEDGNEPGLMGAIIDFMKTTRLWDVDYYSHECNGLLILKRRV